MLVTAVWTPEQEAEINRLSDKLFALGKRLYRARKSLNWPEVRKINAEIDAVKKAREAYMLAQGICWA